MGTNEGEGMKIKQLDTILANARQTISDQRSAYNKQQEKRAKQRRKPNWILVTGARYYIIIESRLSPFLGKCLMVLKEDFGRIRRVKS